MDLNWLQSLLFGLVSGLTDILPVSAQAHKAILLKLFGLSSEPVILRFMIHIATFAGLYYCCQGHIMRISRQLRLARIPKKRRKRPLDTRTLMDFKLLRMMIIPVILAFFAYQKTSAWNHSLNWIALFVLLNAVIMYLPVLMPSGNKDSRSFSPVEGLLMGLGGATAIVPGISSVGATTSVLLLRGADRSFALNMALLLHMAVTACMAVMDVVSMASYDIGIVSFGAIICCILAAAAAFAGVFLAIKILRILAVNIGFNLFAFYNLGLALFSFILFLTA
ncbi:MAG: undecaprenyl-diphosphate phosphatase [Oscillospiraceae bacterium]|nr:undecaprenyl-diphosphate phosphatase [Oscillospiraceae bacterium]